MVLSVKVPESATFLQSSPRKIMAIKLSQEQNVCLHYIPYIRNMMHTNMSKLHYPATACCNLIGFLEAEGQ